MAFYTIIGYEGHVEDAMDRVLIVGKAVLLHQVTKKPVVQVPDLEVEIQATDQPWLVFLVDEKLPSPFSFGYQLNTGDKRVLNCRGRYYVFKNKIEAKKYVKKLMKWLTGASKGVANN